MAGSIVYGADAGNAASATTITRTATYTASDRIIVWLKWFGDAVTASVADGTHTFNQIGGYVTEPGDRRGALFEAVGVAGGSFTITATFSSAVVDRAIAYVRGVGLNASAAQTGTGQIQDPVSGGTDTGSTGNMTPTAQPNIVLGFAVTKASAASISAGTGYTSLGNIPAYDAIAGDTSLVEWRRTTSTSAIAATFTMGGSDSLMSLGAVFGEGVSGGTNTTKVMTDTTTVSDTFNDPVRRVRLMSDTVVASDAVVQWRRLKRVMDEAVTVIDSVVKNVILGGTIVYTKVMTDTLSATDALIQWLRRVRGPIDTVTLSDGDTYRFSIITADESVDVADGFVSWRRLVRLAQDTASVTDGFAKTLAGAGIVYAKVMSDTVTLIDDAGQRWRLRFTQLTDAVGLSDQVIRSLRAVRSLGDVVELSDGTVKIRRTVRSMDESIEISDGTVSTLYLDQVSNTSFSFGSSGPPFRFGGM